MRADLMAGARNPGTRQPCTNGPSSRPRTEPTIDWVHTPHLTPGNYRARSRCAAAYWDRQFRRWVCAVQFDIFDDSLLETLGRCTWYLNLGSKLRPKSGRRSRYWNAWVKANGGPPSRRDRLSPSIFEGRYAVVEVKSSSKTFQCATVEPDFAYSVIRNVVMWETGSTNHSNHTSRKGPPMQLKGNDFRGHIVNGSDLADFGPSRGQG
jgi:hypothetical protein